MDNRKERERTWRKQEILAAAEKLFAKRGFFKTSMADISEVSEFPLATIYKFFQGKEDIYYTLINEKADLFMIMQKEAIEKIRTVKSKMKVLAERHLRFFEENRDFFKIYISERNGLAVTIREDLGGYIHKKHEEYIQFVTAILREGIKKGEVREMDPLKMALLMVGSLDTLTYRWIADKVDETLSDNLQFLINVLFGGILISNS